MELKRCSECGRMLPISKFNKNRNSRDGLQDRCRECFSAYNRRRYQEKRDRKRKDMHDGGKTMAESPHMIACFLDGEWTDTVPADEVATALGMSERKILRYASTTKPIPRTGISLVDLTDFPRSTCPGCILECEKPWPCSEAVRYFARRYRHHAGSKSIDITGRRVNGTARACAFCDYYRMKML